MLQVKVLPIGAPAEIPAKMRRIAFCLGICLTVLNLRETAASRNEACMEPKQEGEVTDSKLRSIQWFYDSAGDRCQPFVYTGKGGNSNRFLNETYCLKTCSATYLQKFPDGDAVCDLQKERGDCHANILKWYYDLTINDCETFLFSGCHGNGNQFDNKKSCRRLCAAKGQGRFNVETEEEEVQQRDEGDTAAIVFGCLFGIAVIAFVAVFVIQRKRQKSQNNKSKRTELEMQ
ncbi:carboxypeptidase inhibitor SmCI-like [Rhincodon typus]|uniref:carboxypeptidase inhibitor SmCI-like n=1 Tax=Rhincodon typus TaxID=259920 RepID=UPI00202F8CB4|nr:carboxypeptidase inhibitor SmCI-like [Rhincodon typus]